MSLTPDEKQQLARRITRGTQVVCSSIAQLHLGSPDPNAPLSTDDTGIIRSLREHGQDRWKFTNIEGALLLTRDRYGVCNFRIYDLDVFKLRFQYELYENLDYMRLNEKCHAFEMESCVCGFSFSDAGVAAKFYDRVQGNIIRNNNNLIGSGKRGAGIMSPGFKPPPGPMQQVETRQQEPARSASRNEKAKSGNVFLENGLLDAENVPNEWKRILKQAGIKKKDLRDPKMQEVIRDVLSQYNISLDPPPLDMDDEEIRMYYTAEQLAEYEQYKRDLAAYEEDMRRYEQEMEEFEKQQAKQAKLEKMLKDNESKINKQLKNSDMSGADRLRMSVMQFTGQELRDVLPMGDALKQEQAMAPRMSVAKPLVPALPIIPKENESSEHPKRGKKQKGNGLSKEQNKLMEMVDSRNSKMLLKVDFLKDIKKQEYNLRRVSALPKISGMREETKNDLMAKLIDRVKQQRADLGEGESDSEVGSDDFSDPDD